MNSIRLWPRRAGLTVALLLLMVATSVAQNASDECLVRVTLLQVNDVYQFTPVDEGKAGGLGRLAILRQRIMSESQHTLFLMSGDTISPSVESLTYKGQQMIDAWNAIGLDFAVFGNHEFDFGPKPDTLLSRIKESRFVWLGANVIDKTTKKTFANTPPFVIREFDNVKVGIFGLVLPDTTKTSSPGENIDFRDVCQTARRIIPQMRAGGAGVIVALTHLSMAEDKQLARCAPGIDVIIGGHEHTLLQSASAGTPIFKMTSDAREMGRIQLNISAASGKLQSIDWEIIPVNSEVDKDTEFAAARQPFDAAMLKYDALLEKLAVQVGSTAVVLNAKSQDNRTRETNIGNFIADAFRRVADADIGFVNGGSIRADDNIRAGNLTERNVLSILPFPNPVVKIEVTGETLLKVLEHGVSRSKESSEPGEFPQVSGLRFTFDASKPAGQRVTEVFVNGQPLDKQKTYTLATSDFLAVKGGDGYSMLPSAKLLTTPQAAQKAPDILRTAIKSMSPINPQVEGRIKRLDQTSGGGKQEPCKTQPKPRKRRK
ncbi:MAG: bifunctional metallophosphatase/5'-nucleotidase [Pyrinomonadaceae bacterium]|nr:bifunctional metallophosphatase/5'-nucleotidase [Pyrinomonadaceae bacterium]